MLGYGRTDSTRLFDAMKGERNLIKLMLPLAGKVAKSHWHGQISANLTARVLQVTLKWFEVYQAVQGFMGRHEQDGVDLMLASKFGEEMEKILRGNELAKNFLAALAPDNGFFWHLHRFMVHTHFLLIFAQMLTMFLGCGCGGALRDRHV